MSSLHIYCLRCGSTNDPGVECCHLCKQPLHPETSTKSVQKELMSHPQRVRQKMSRRTVLLGITAGMVALPVTAGAAYLTYKKLFDPPIDPHHILTYSGHEVATDAAW